MQTAFYLLLLLLFFFLGGGGVEMVIGWICSRDLFETSWEGLHEVLPNGIAEESRTVYVCAFIASVALLS